MAMFDIGKRGSGSSQNESKEDEDFLREFDTPREGVVPPPSAAGGVRSREAAIIGPSIHIEGTLRGEEDLIIEGRVSGTVKLQGHSLTVGSHGQISANIYAHTVVVDGTVEGDLFGAERVMVRKTADIRGNITSPRVSLEEGARFKGAIEMDAQAVESAMGTQKGKSTGTTGQSSSINGGNSGSAPSRTESTSSVAAASSASAGKAGGSDNKASASGKASSSAG